jgi:hypothetical protein
MAKEYSFIHIPDVLVMSRSHPDQGSNKMADIVLKECNQLLSNFIRDLSSNEIMSATGHSLAKSYADIALNMYGRGFYGAGQLAEKFARENSNQMETITRNVSYIRKRIINTVKSLIPLKIKQAIKASIGFAMPRVASESQQLKEKFSEVYEKNIFGGHVSRSGEGSNLVQTENIRYELPKIIKEFSIETFMDAPCGDWYWMKETNLGVEHYIGVDIVDAMIERHKKDFGSPFHNFQCLNLATDSLPKADLIFCRDCLVHLSFVDALKVIANFKKSGAKYLLTTTFADRERNADLVGVDSFWRPLNMCLTPFDFPEPILVINEGCTEGAGLYVDKCLGLWLMSDIKI